jgi:hypothetical protein
MSKQWLNRKKGRQILLRDKMRKHLESNWKGVGKATRERELDRLRWYLVEGLDDLVLAANTLPAEEQNEIFTEDRIKPLVSALLTASEKKKRVQSKNDESRNVMVDREFQIAAMFMQKGISKCLDRVREPYGERMWRDASGVMMILNYEATKGKQVGASVDVSEIQIGDWREKVPPLLPVRAQK